MDKTQETLIIRFKNDQSQEEMDTVVVEFPLTLFINELEYTTLLCTPSNLKALIIGHLKNDFLIESFEDIQSMIIDESKGVAYLEIDKDIKEHLSFKNRYITSGCASSAMYYDTLDAIKLRSLSTSEPFQVKMSDIYKNMSILNQHSELFKSTGGVHIAGLFDTKGPIYLIEDIGRHNAVDKVIGLMLINQIQSDYKMMFISGRISSEMVLKCAKQDIKVIVSRSAPMNLAIRMAESLNMVLIGFVRGEKGNVYTAFDYVKI
ncbi:MAG: formate dehydrogenase accessory sulfurtransferase FdhD [Clostridiales bacterium]|nr:formate dehydrogenase accessory sulfurtransferase FdhD [Clostridiales bacterium]